MARVDAQIEGKREQLAILSCRKEEMLDNLETARLAGMGVPDFNREAVDALSAETDNAKRELGAILSDRTRLKKILIELEQSTHGILTRLDGIRVDSAALHILETPQTGRNSPETTNVHHHRHISTIYSQNVGYFVVFRVLFDCIVCRCRYQIRFCSLQQSYRRCYGMWM